MEDKKKLTFAEIVATLNALGISKVDALDDDVLMSDAVVAALGAVEKVHEEEVADDPNYMENVYHFVDHGVYVEIQYAFWPDHGPGEPDYYTEVTPRKVEVTVYDNVEGSYVEIKGSGFDAAEEERKEATERLKQMQEDADDRVAS